MRTESLFQRFGGSLRRSTPRVHASPFPSHHGLLRARRRHRGADAALPKVQHVWKSSKQGGHQDDVNAVSGLSYDIQVIFMATEKEKVDQIQNSVKQIVQLHCHCACHPSDS